MGALADFRNRIVNWLLDGLNDAYRQRGEFIALRRDYRQGVQPRQLKVRPGQFDDNLTINFAGLVVDRSVSMLFGKGVTFDLPGEGETAESQYIEAVWDANKQEILLHKLATLGAESGTCYVKIVPGGVYGLDGELYPRLVALDPLWVTMDTAAEDIEQVIRYTIRYNVAGPDGKTRGRKQVIELQDGPIDTAGFASGGQWMILDYQETTGGNRWELVSTQTWADAQGAPYDFPPILHWQNLPEPTDVYGKPDITEDVIRLQDRINFTAGNISKIIRLYAHPQRYGKNLGKAEAIQVGPDQMPTFNTDNAEIVQLEQLGDLAGAANFQASLRQALFDITQTVDLSSMADKIGALTNFGLRVLYSDALSRLGVKQELYGDALTELNRRLLIVGGFADADPGEIVWPDVLPVNEQEQVAALSSDLSNEIVSRKTVSQRRGYDWDEEKERIAADKAERQQSFAQTLLENERRFNAGQTQPPPFGQAQREEDEQERETINA